MTAAAIHYGADGYVTARQDLKGRHVAGNGFLRGMARWSSGRLVLAAPTAEQARQGAALVAEDLAKAGREVGWLPLDQPEALRKPDGPGCLFTPGPTMAALARTRQRLDGGSGWSLCGITHAIASIRAMDALSVDLLTAPLEPWDALICTSAAVQAAVVRLLETQAEELARRLGATRFVLPHLPVIPLGVDCDAFEVTPGEREAVRETVRGRMGMGGSDVMMLYVGRLAFHGKANPLPFYLAAERVAATLPPGQSLHLVEAGWFADERQRKAFADCAATLMPSVRRHSVDGRTPEALRPLWAAADIFVSLSDNIQESFGLTPIEAMAAGLPVVVSDWDGYRDTVRDGVDGIRVPTVVPPPGLGDRLALRYDLGLDSYDQYCGLASQWTAVDVGATEQALRRLVQDPLLRRRLGEAGQQRARSMFDWKVIIHQYEALWETLGRQREQDAAHREPSLPPSRMDPFALFGGYATATLHDGMTVSLGPEADPMAAFRVRRGLAVAAVAGSFLLEEAEVTALFHRLSGGPLTVRQVLASVPPPRQAVFARGLLWLAKVDLIRLL